MLFLKLLGAALTLAGTARLGRLLGGRYASRTREIGRWRTALSILATELGFGALVLTQALERMALAVGGHPGGVARRAVALLHEGESSAAAAWRQAVTEASPRCSLTPEDEATLLDLGVYLGATDQEDQLRHLKLAEERMVGSERVARGEQAQRERLLGTLGWITGVLIVLMLL